MENQKEKIIKELYGLRAGLSLVASEYDKYAEDVNEHDYDGNYYEDIYALENVEGCINDLKESLANDKNKLAPLDKTIDEKSLFSINLDSLLPELKKAQTEKEKVEWSLNATLEALEEISKSKKTHSDTAKAIYTTLKKQYASLLNPVDWENIDLIIYYLETGRANTRQEALQQVDRQKQTDQIVYAINDAAERICNTIKTSFNQLESSIIKCTQIISAQLNTININQQLIASEIASTKNVIKAFYAKTNISSEKLLSQVDYICTCTENRAIKGRNS